MNCRTWALNLTRLAGAAALAGAVAMPAMADMAPDAMVQQISNETLSAIKADPAMQRGDVNRIMGLVDSKIMPNVNFTRMTSSAVGPRWREATPAQRQQLQAEFKRMLVRTYAGAFKLAGNRDAKVQPLRGAPGNDVVVRTQLVGGGASTNLDYRLERASGSAMGWRVYNVAVGGIWQIENFRGQFAPTLQSRGIDGLIAAMAAQNNRTGQ